MVRIRKRAARTAGGAHEEQRVHAPNATQTQRWWLVTGQDATRPFSHLRVLVVDDHDDARSHLEGLLSAHGVRPTLCADGLECVDALATGNWDLVLLDLQMPRMDGVQVLQWLKDQQAPVPHVVVVSTSMRRASELLELGAASVLPKPLTRERLHTILGAVLHRAP